MFLQLLISLIFQSQGLITGLCVSNKVARDYAAQFFEGKQAYSH